MWTMLGFKKKFRKVLGLWYIIFLLVKKTLMDLSPTRIINVNSVQMYYNENLVGFCLNLKINKSVGLLKKY